MPKIETPSKEQVIPKVTTYIKSKEKQTNF